MNSTSSTGIDWKNIKSDAFTYENLIGKTNRVEVYHVTLKK